MRWVEPKRWSPLRALVFVGFCAFALLGWEGVTTVGRLAGDDAWEHLAYARYLDAHGHLPGKAINYEFASPPLFQATAVAAERLVRHLPSVALEPSWNPITRILWLALVVGGALALTARRRGPRRAGAAAIALALVWALDEAISLSRSESWSVGQLIALLAGIGLLGATGLIAREIWPDRPRRAVAAVAFVAAYPVVFRMSVFFHPEMPFALLCALAVLVFLAAARRGWPSHLGYALGAALGAAALTRQPAVVVIGCLGVAGLYLGRRGAAGFLTRAAIVLVLLAGPWWAYATVRFGNPLQSNLVPRGVTMMSSQPLSFYLSFPLRTLILHPYRPDFADALFPKLHADLWSDWYGYVHVLPPDRLARVTMSSQSLLGLVGDALAIGGLAALAVPAAFRVIRRGSRTPGDVGLGLLALIALGAFAAFVVEVIRFPQQYDDPIKSSYLLFTAPCWAIFSVAAWNALARHRRLAVALVAVAGLYVVSYGTDLAASLRPADRAVLRRAGRLRRSRRRHPAEFAESGSGRPDRLPRRRHELGQPDRDGRRPDRQAATRDAPPRRALLRARLGVHRPDDDRLQPQLPRGRQLDPDPLLGPGLAAGAADDDRLGHLGRAGRQPREQRHLGHGHARTRRLGVRAAEPGAQLGEHLLVQLGAGDEEAEQEGELVVGVTRVQLLAEPLHRLVEGPEHLAGLLGEDDVDPAAVRLVADATGEPGPLEPVEHRRHRPGGETHQLGEPPGGRAALLLEDVDAAVVRAVEPDRVGNRLVVGVGAVLRAPYLEVDRGDQLVAPAAH